MIKKLLLIAILSCSFVGIAQEQVKDTVSEVSDEIIELTGKIVSGDDKKPLAGAHVFNMNTIRGAISDSEGNFTIPVKANDTIFLSHLGYQSLKVKITNDLTKGNPLDISLYEQAELIEEVQVQTIQLVGVLEIDSKNVPTDKYTRIHINGLPQTYEVGKPKKKTYSSPVDAIFHPVDFVYNLFGSKPKQLKKLKQMREENEVRDMLNSKVNRELMLEYLEMSRQELDELLDECNYSEYFVKNASDIQVIEAVIECYENYRAVKKGTTKKD
ncbi:MAG: TonB-dependent receptor [Bacteroidetes bacterium MedPE-SWsnd-G1]|nr:MAG: TonB-dependent receptor [Bacteroidetes bacterium MedPE-SWsnd-G1]